MSGKLKMVLQCVAAGVCLFYSLPRRSRAVGLVAAGDFALVGGGADGRIPAWSTCSWRCGCCGIWRKIMEFPNIVLVPILIPLAVLALAAASAAIWIVVLARWWMRLPVIPYQPRRPAPWRGVHVLFALVVYLALAQSASRRFITRGLPRPPATRGSASGGEHPIAKMLAGGRDNPWLLLTAFFTAVLAAPIVEELFFRVLLQGWLEAPSGAGDASGRSGVLPGARPDRPQLDPLRRRPLPRVGDRSAADGHRDGHAWSTRSANWRPSPAFSSFCEAVAAPRRPTSAGSRRSSPPTCDWDCWRPWRRCRRSTWRRCLLKNALPDSVTPDFLALIPLAAVLGTLYYRTHRLAPSVVAHAAFNVAGLLWWITSGA